jgi:hypothetical protein
MSSITYGSVGGCFEWSNNSSVVPVVVLDRYVGEYKAASGFSATFRRGDTTLFVKSIRPSGDPASAGQLFGEDRR